MHAFGNSMSDIVSNAFSFFFAIVSVLVCHVKLCMFQCAYMNHGCICCVYCYYTFAGLVVLCCDFRHACNILAGPLHVMSACLCTIATAYPLIVLYSYLHHVHVIYSEFCFLFYSLIVAILVRAPGC